MRYIVKLQKGNLEEHDTFLGIANTNSLGMRAIRYRNDSGSMEWIPVMVDKNLSPNIVSQLIAVLRKNLG